MNQQNAQPFLTFNPGSAEKSGGSVHVQDGGPYVCTIKSAKYVAAKSGSHGIEFSVETEGGLKANYLTAYYAKSDGSPINSGNNLLCAIMGFLGIQGLTFQAQNIDGQQENIVPELTGKCIGLFLQKKLYTKRDGKEGYSFDIRCPYDPHTMQTFAEKNKGKDAKSIKTMTDSYSDDDERKSNACHQPQAGHNGPTYDDSDIPFN